MYIYIKNIDTYITYIYIYIYIYIYLYINMLYNTLIHVYTRKRVHIFNSFICWKHFDILIFIWLMLQLQINLLHSFEASSTDYKRLKTLTSFNNTTLNNRIQTSLASWMIRVLSPFDFTKNWLWQSTWNISQCFYGCIRYYWVAVKQLI